MNYILHVYIYIYCTVGTEGGYMPDCRGSILSRGKIFLFSTMPRPDLGPIYPSIEWVWEDDFFRDRKAEA
jgi:hypothetical protein